MSNKLLTQEEWDASISQMWCDAIKETYQDMLDKAIRKEREECAQICGKLGDKAALDQNFYALSALEEAEQAIRARGQE